MSHNKIKVGGQEPNASGEISLSLNNVDNVDTTGAVDGNVLIYRSTPNKFLVSNASVNLGMIFLSGKGATANYPQTLSASDNVYYYDESPINTISGATLLDSDSIGSNWYDGVTLPAGVYDMVASLHGDYTGSTGITTFSIKAGSTETGCIAQDVDGANNSDYPSDAHGYIELTSSANIVVDIASVTAANSTTTTAQSERGFLKIMKVG